MPSVVLSTTAAARRRTTDDDDSREELVVTVARQGVLAVGVCRRDGKCHVVEGGTVHIDDEGVRAKQQQQSGDAAAGKRFASSAQRQQQQECPVGSTDETCSSSGGVPQQPPHAKTATTGSGPPVLMKRTLGTLGRIKNRLVNKNDGQNGHPNRDCCAEFESCVIGSPNSLSRCALMRGGHMMGGGGAAASASAEALGQAAVKHMPYGIPLNGWKVIFQALLTTLNVLCWLIPLRSKQISENKLALSLANAFSGGVFLSLAFGHLIPECVHGFEGVTNEVTPYLLVLSGYLLIFFIEKVAFDAHEILHEMEHAHDEKVAAAAAAATAASAAEPPTQENGSKTATMAPGAVSTDSTMSEDDNTGAVSSSTSGRSALILLGALAVHSILEMAALGLADTFSDSAILTLSIALHQPAESIALLVAFLKSGMSKGEIIRFLSIFSAMGPIGVALGMAVNEFAAPIVDSIMVAIVAGTFVYVGATEVIPEEWEDSEHKW
eukprot:CAMPEP_0113488280 /NCGR_PEP_ID=MMETSP0014_2-20120614/25937_1 /TAXON_ID=2857 /ORGANISM="Nitzschia sp." /LENGTH=493 /DNA_ID=CAMNT_0000381991 /DNA_START=56 /DNA_END=1535 /DNA_ORIENTATION=+ /assembly_acc=CAM_ASM_000159